MSLLSFLFCVSSYASKKYPDVVDNVFCASDEQKDKSWYYVSEYYYKGFLDLKRKNIAVHFAPNRRFYEKGGRTLFSEITGTLSHSHKTQFHQRETYRFDAIPNTNTAQEYSNEFYHITLYQQFLLPDQLLSPLCRENARYYRYVEERHGNGEVLIYFKAKHKNAQLVSGYFVYDSRQRYVTKINFKGDYGTVRFNYTGETGTEGEERFWPVHASLIFRYRFYGNIFDGRSEFYQKYTTLDPNYEYPTGKNGKHDHTHIYKTDETTNPLVIDSTQIALHRPVPLTNEEQALYHDTYKEYRFTPTSKPQTNSSSSSRRWLHTIGDIGEVFFRSHGYNFSDRTSLDLSRLDLGYSGSNGVTLRQDVNYTHYTCHDLRFTFAPKIGYYFTPKMLVWQLRTEYEYFPYKNGTFSLEFGSRDIANSTDRIESMVTGMPLQKTEDAKGILFNDRYLELLHSIELTNGLDILIGAIYHSISPHRMSNAERMEIGMKKSYTSFAPHINISYTPAITYYYKGKRKIRLGSHYPTFSIDYESGLRDILNTDNQYEKWEGEVSQLVNLSPIRNLYWKIGGGMFTNKKNVNFVNYRYFSRGSVIHNWNDERSGVFQLLDNKYYYNSTHYIRMHLTMESPTILLGNVSTRYLQSERLYLNNLITEGLVPYVELGYGISTVLFDANIFSSYLKEEGFKQGVKFTLHL